MVGDMYKITYKGIDLSPVTGGETDYHNMVDSYDFPEKKYWDMKRVVMEPTCMAYDSEGNPVQL